MSRQEGGARFSRRKFFTEFFEQAAVSQDDQNSDRMPTSQRSWGTYAIAGTGVSLIAVEVASQMDKGEFPNMQECKTDRADYRIIYGIHNRIANPRGVEKVDGLLLEMGFDSSDNVESVEIAIREAEVASHLKQYVAILAEARRLKVPVFIIDVDLSVRTGLDVVIKVLEFMFGMALSANMLFPKNEQLSRRAFVNKLGGVLGVWLLTPIVADLTTIPSTITGAEGPVERSLSRTVGRGLRRFNEVAHPEADRTMLQFRNTFMAQKSESVASHLHSQLGRRPKLNVHVGAAHTGIERALKVNEARRMSEIRDGLGEKEFEQHNCIIRIDFVDEDGNPIVDENGNESMQVTLLQDPAFQN